MARFLAACLVVAAAGWLYAWTPATFPTQGFSREPAEFYPELAQALLQGHAHLERQPDTRLLRLADPYDPAQNAPYRVDNLSYFAGRYYLYMGVGPALLLFAPVKLLTGFYPSQAWAVIGFCLLGLAAGIGTVLRLAKAAVLPPSPALFTWISLVLAFASGHWVVLPGTLAQEVAVAGGYAFAMVALFACTRALFSERARVWFALASLAFGAAVASRPSYVFASVALLPPFLCWWSRQGRRGSPAFWSAALAAAAPLLAVVVALLAYNHARFGSIFEFGQHYLLGGWDQRRLPASAGSAGLANAWRYLVAPGHYSRDFPFVTARSPLAIGVFLNLPWLWLAPIAFRALARRSGAAAARAMGASALLLAAANLLVLIFLPSGGSGAGSPSANARYELDFLPDLILGVSIGFLLAAAELKAAGLAKRCLGMAAGATAAVSILSGLSLNFERFPPESYRRLSLALDLPDFALRSLGPPAFGPVGLDVTFPASAVGRYEPLVESGGASAANLLYAFFPAKDEIQFGFVGTGMRGPLSDRIPISPGPVHHLEVSLGALDPPLGYPTLARFSEAQVAYLKRNLQVNLDGRTVFAAVACCYPASPRSVRFGENRLLPDYSADRFSGRILSIRRLAIVAPDEAHLPPPAYGAVRLILRLPRGESGRCEPLVVSGLPQAGDFLFVRYLDGHHLSLGLDHWGGRGVETPPLAVDYSVEHTVEISMGSLYPPAQHRLLAALTPADRDRLKHQVTCTWDGKPVLAIDRETYDSSPYDVTIGLNAIGGSTCDYAFTGRVVSAARLAPIAR